jgi:hypothetical protein
MRSSTVIGSKAVRFAGIVTAVLLTLAANYVFWLALFGIQTRAGASLNPAFFSLSSTLGLLVFCLFIDVISWHSWVPLLVISFLFVRFIPLTRWTVAFFLVVTALVGLIARLFWIPDSAFRL